MINMNKLLLSAVLLLFLSGGDFAQERTWETFSPESGEWSILSPGVMKSDEEASNASGTKGSYSYNDSKGFFAVVYRNASKPLLFTRKSYQNAYYKKTLKDAVKAAKGELIKDQEFSNGDINGREFWIRTTYRVQRFRMFFHDNRFYMLLVVLPEDQINTPEINNYFNSFAFK